jgi:hypothetical protein
MQAAAQVVQYPVTLAALVEVVPLRLVRLLEKAAQQTLVVAVQALVQRIMLHQVLAALA